MVKPWHLQYNPGFTTDHSLTIVFVVKLHLYKCKKTTTHGYYTFSIGPIKKTKVDFLKGAHIWRFHLNNCFSSVITDITYM